MRPRPLYDLNLSYHPLSLVNHELTLTAFSAHRAAVLKVPLPVFSNFLNQENASQQPLQCPHSKLRMSIKTTLNPAKRNDKKTQSKHIDILTAEEAALYRALSQSIYKTHNK